MIELYFKSLFTQKHKIYYFIIFSILILLFFLFLIEPAETKEVLLNEETIYLDFKNKFAEFIKFILPILTLFLVINHDQQYIKSFIPYFNRSKIHLVKQLVFLILSIIILFIIICINIITLIQNNMIVKIDYMFYINIFLTINIMTQYYLMFTSSKNKVSTLVVCFVLMAMTLIQEQVKSINLFYLIPITPLLFKNYNYYIQYQLIYLINLVILNFQKSNIEKIII